MPPGPSIPPPPTKYRLWRSNPDIDSIGHHSIEVQVQTVTLGPAPPVVMDQGIAEKYGISAEELVSRFGGDVEKWLTWVGQDMLRKYKQRIGIQTTLLQKHNTATDIT